MKVMEWIEILHGSLAAGAEVVAWAARAAVAQIMCLLGVLFYFSRGIHKLGDEVRIGPPTLGRECFFP
jgi:hypothetical protein